MNNYNEWLYEWFSKRNPDVNISKDTDYFNQNLIDSLGIIELVEDLEANFKIQFISNDFQDRRFSSIKGLAEIMSEKKSGEL